MRNYLLAAAAAVVFAAPGLALAADPAKSTDTTTAAPTAKAKPAQDKADKTMPSDKAKPADDSAAPASDTSTAPADKTTDSKAPDAPK
jgi:hypothetical protein